MKISILAFIVILPHYLSAQQNFGPRLSALGDNGAAVADVWSLRGNAAAITDLETTTISLNYIRHFLSQEISTQGLVAVIPIDNNFIGIGLNRYGLSNYNQNTISFAYAKKFGNRFSMAMTVNYHQLKITNYGSSNGFSVDVGFYYKIDQKLNLGAYVTNPSKQKFVNAEISAPIPTSLNIGASYLLTDKVQLATTISKLIDDPIDVRLGLEYRLIKLLSLRAGVTANPFKQFAGFGVKVRKLSIDFATAFDNNLGYSPQIALGYAF